ncbi:hypothetical protein Q8F55_000736 [Vanrija albida]|uniref:Major facilitator superfamily (MFS) profile domain-containing protein n=1 Tax=Vanrija albida TaxID=181172 RepID=A0ABR3QEQ6_9TREE
MPLVTPTTDARPDPAGAGPTPPPASRGAAQMDALHTVFTGARVYLLWAAIGLVFYLYSLSYSTTYVYAAFATSSFGAHTVVGTVAVVTAVLSGVVQPFNARVADLVSRPAALALALALYTLGYALTAGARTVAAVVAGQALYTLGTAGIYQIQYLLLADLTPLKWRGVAIGVSSLPMVLNAFVGPFITKAVGALSANGWRWGYGMFCILMPVGVLPAVVLLAWAQRKSRGPEQGRQVLGVRNLTATLARGATLADAPGLLLLGFALALLLLPPTLSTTAKGGYTNPSLIAMFAVGGVLLLTFVAWERVAAHPILPRRIMNRTFLTCTAINALYYLATYLSETYYLSWVYVLKPGWSDAKYAMFGNALVVTLWGGTLLSGAVQRLTRRNKPLLLAGLAIRVVGEGVQFLTVNGNSSDVAVVFSRVLIGLGGACQYTATQVAVQACVPHADMAAALALQALATYIGSSVAGAVSAAVWNAQVPARLEKYLGDRYDAAQRATIFGSIIAARAAEPHALVVRAYTESLRPLFAAALALAGVTFFLGFVIDDIVLGDTHNAVEDKVVRLGRADADAEEGRVEGEKEAWGHK